MTTYPLKRTIDVLGSLFALTFLWPVMVVIAVCVRLDSPGPAFFRQERVGQSRVTFEILKFRTMSDRRAEEVDQVAEQVVTGGRDSRITRAGRFLRASSLDELPQLLNILRGDMSLIGPRPIIPDQLEAIPQGRDQRFEVRPGLTGLAQVKGRRGLDWLKQLELDAEYVRTCSFLLDVQIVLRTVLVVLTAAGVYGGEGSNWRAYRPETDTSDRATDGGPQ